MNNQGIAEAYESIDPFDFALNVAKGANCVKKKVGAVLLGFREDGYGPMVFTGSGGVSIHQGPFCVKNEDGLCPRKYMSWSQDGCWSIHSEQRALMDALMLREKVSNYDDRDLKKLYPGTVKWIMFITHGPCDQCIKWMHDFQVDMAVYDVEYKTDYSKWSGMIEIVQRTKFEEALYA